MRVVETAASKQRGECVEEIIVAAQANARLQSDLQPGGDSPDAAQRQQEGDG